MLMQILEPGRAAKADTLVQKVSAVFKDEARVRFTHPVQHAEVRVRDVVPPFTADIAGALAAASNCKTEEVRTRVMSDPVLARRIRITVGLSLTSSDQTGDRSWPNKCWVQPSR